MKNILYLKRNKAIIAESTVLDSFDEAKQLFLLSCRAKNLSGGTVRWYEAELEVFKKFLDVRYQGLHFNAITAAHIREFITHLQEAENKLYRGRKLSSYTVAGFVRSIRAFFSFLSAENYLQTNPAGKICVPRVQKKIIQPLSLEEIQRLLAVPDKKTFTGFRNFLLMLIFLDSGLRLSELLNLKRNDVDMERKTLRILGKGNKEREVPFGVLAARHLVKYLKWRGDIPGQELVFVNRYGMKMQSRRVQEKIKEYGKLAGIERLHPHRFRHTTALHWVKAGGDALSLQRLLGHAGLDMVRNYVNLASDDVALKHRQFGLVDRLNFSGGKKHEQTF